MGVNLFLKEFECIDIASEADPDDIDLFKVGKGTDALDLNTKGLDTSGGLPDGGGDTSGHTGTDITEKLEGEVDIGGLHPFGGDTTTRPEPVLEPGERLPDLAGEVDGDE